MNKSRIDARIACAYQAIDKCGLLQEGKLPAGLRGQIASFGAGVRNGSLLAAVAFFTQKGGAQTDRHKLMDCIYYILNGDQPENPNQEALFEAVLNKEVQRDDVLEAAVALKLAMNLYPWDNGGKEGQDGKSGNE